MAAAADCPKFTMDDSSPLLTLVLPVLNDAANLRRCLKSLDAQRTCTLEILVVDGGDCQETRRVCQEFDVLYMATTPGRARQMNAAAARARGVWLWFLHADTIVPAVAVSALQECCRQERAVWGCFQHRIDHGSWVVRVIETAANLRARILRLPYGDQGIFVRRDAFQQVGGYAETPLLEDVILARRLRPRGAMRYIPLPLVSDGRRWKQLGVLRTTWRNWAIICLYFCGCRSYEALADFYRQPPMSPYASMVCLLRCVSHDAVR